MLLRGPKCKLGYHCTFTLILWVLYTGMPWKCLPVPTDREGKAEIHSTAVDKVFAKWADDGSIEHAFVASVGHLSEHNQLDLSILHGGMETNREMRHGPRRHTDHAAPASSHRPPIGATQPS